MLKLRILSLFIGLISPSYVAADVEISLFSTLDSSQILDGGLRQSDSHRVHAGVNIDIDLSPNWRFVTSLQTLQGDNGNEDSGDIQIYSNIDAPEFTMLYDLFVEGHFLNDSMRIKPGQFDANAEFLAPDNASEFINSSMGFSPTVTFLPTYPIPAPGAALFITLDDNTDVGFALFGNNNESFSEKFYISELIHQGADMRLKLGVWQWQSAQLSRPADDVTDTRTEGIYAVAEGDWSMSLFSSQRMGWFLQTGLSEQNYNPMNLHIGTGLIIEGLFADKKQSAGFGLTYVATSSQYHGDFSPASPHETAIEIFYKFAITDYLSVKPDIQFIVSPATVPAVDNVVVATLRFEWSA